MARRNPYAMDPNLARGISNLTRALIGSAADDAALARGRASDALARKYDAETEGQGIKNRRDTDLSAAIAQASDPSGLLAGSILESLGGQMDNGNMIQKVMPDGPQMSVPMNANQVNMTQADQLKNLGGLTRAFFGDGTYNPTQFAGGLQGIQNTIARNLATTLAQGSDDERRQAMTLMGKNPGQYFDSGVAQRGQDLTAETARRGQDIDSADKRRGQDITDTTNRRGQDLDSADKRRGQDIDDRTIRWKHNNRTVSMTVEPGKQIILDPQTGRKLGIEPTMVTDGGETKEMYVLDGGPALGKIKVSVPQGGTVFMDQKTAEAIGVKKDKDGQWKVMGQPKSSSSSTKDSRKRPTMKVIDQAYTDDIQSVDNWSAIPNAVRGKVKGTLLKYTNDGMKSNPDMDYPTAYATAVSSAIREGVVNIDTGFGDGLSDFAVPAYFYRVMSTAANFQALGYSKKQAEAIVKQKSEDK